MVDSKLQFLCAISEASGSICPSSSEFGADGWEWVVRSGVWREAQPFKSPLGLWASCLPHAFKDLSSRYTGVSKNQGP